MKGNIMTIEIAEIWGSKRLMGDMIIHDYTVLLRQIGIVNYYNFDENKLNRKLNLLSSQCQWLPCIK